MTRVLLRDTLWTNALPTGVAIGVDLELGVLFAKGNTLNVNLYLKMEAHNTASGPSLQLLYIHRF